jgi:hypothetical protein
VNAETYTARETLIGAANRALMADRLDHSGANDAAEQEYADDMLAAAAQAFVAALDELPGVLVPRERLERLENIERAFPSVTLVYDEATHATLQARLGEARRAAHANAQRITELEAELSRTAPMAAAAHTYCAARLPSRGWAGPEEPEVNALLAAHRATTPSETPPTHVVVAVEELERLKDALRLISGEKCENYTGDWRCWDDGMGRTRGARYTAEAWCDACIAQAALNGRVS